MQDQLKQRLVGAVVLVALAVIFLPMVLDGDKRSGIPTFGSNVPEAPAGQGPVIDIPLEMPPPPAEVATVVEQPVVPATAAAPAVPPVPKPTAPAATPAKVAPAPAPVAAQPAPAPAVVAAKPSAGDAWAVQVGSFSDSVNATKLRNTLRTKGFPAFVEQAKGDNGVSYRVRVGPVLARSEAEAIQEKLAATGSAKGIVVHHP